MINDVFTKSFSPLFYMTSASTGSLVSLVYVLILVILRLACLNSLHLHLILSLIGWKNPFLLEFFMHYSMASSISLEKSETHPILGPYVWPLFCSGNLWWVFFFCIDNFIVFNNFIMMCLYLSLVFGGPFNLQLMFWEFAWIIFVVDSLLSFSVVSF